MTLTLDHAQVYDIECLSNCFTLTAAPLFGEGDTVWEVSPWRDDRQYLLQWLRWCQDHSVPMIGFNNEGYDYPLLHLFMSNPASVSYQQFHEKSQQIINSGYGDNRWAHTIWPRDRFAPQIDLYKLHHFDNRAKQTSLKAVQFAMRSPSVVESTIPFDRPVELHEVNGELIPYNQHDVLETKRFAHYSMDAITFRTGLIGQFGIDCLNWNDTKIGEKMLEQRLGEDVCYDRSSGRKERRQTIRTSIALRDIIFPYVQFQNPEFQRVHRFMLDQVLKPDELDTEDTTIKTKGVFTDLSATVGGLTFHFGTGGVHASVEAQRFVATEEWLIRDIDVARMYPSIAIVNQLAPAHLGPAFVAEYSKISIERKQHAKGTYMNAALKLAANGAWGKSNSIYSCFYDPAYAMTIPINGQLLICMLAEWLLVVPTMSFVSVNTDGITYRIHRDHLPQAQQIEKRWEDYTKLTLESVHYSRLWVADVNSYIAEYAE